VTLQSKFQNRSASDIVLDDRPDAALRYEIDYNASIFISWLDGMLKQTKTTGSGKHRKTVPKYTLGYLLGHSDQFNVADAPIDSDDVLNDGYNDDDTGSVVTPGGLILPRSFRDPS
jgi:hypothetical protein